MITPGNDFFANLGLVVMINVAGFLANVVNPVLGTISIAAGIVYIGAKIRNELKK